MRIIDIGEWFCILQVIATATIAESFKGKIELSRPLDANLVVYPFTKKFSYSKEYGERQPDGSWLAVKEFCVGDHEGTHIDAPYHYSEHGWKLGDIPLERFFTKGVLIDFTAEVLRNGPETELTEDHLRAWEKKNGVIPPKTVALIRFGWARHYGNYTVNVGEDSAPRFPGISVGAAEHLTGRKVYGVGVDTPNLDRGGSKTFDAHKILLGSQIYALENLNIPDILPARGISLIIMPINLKYGTGGPVRVVAYPKTLLSSICCNI